MSDSDKQLKRAVAQDGAFDPEKAAAMKRAVVGDFRSKLRKVERTLWIYLTVCVCVAIFAYRAFDRSSSTQAQILFAVVFLVAFESTVLIKLWYWVANTRISVLKEVKLLRLALPERSEPGESPTVESVRSLSRRESVGWYAVLIAAALVVPNVLAPLVGGYKPDLLDRSYVTLRADGSGNVITDTEYQNHSEMPIVSFPFNAPTGEQIHWLDEQGRPMTATADVQGDRTQYTVELPKPAMPGDWIKVTRVTESARLAEKNADGVWSYCFDTTYGHETNDFVVTAYLPEDAAAVSLRAEGQSEHAFHTGRKVFVNGRRDRNQPCRFTVEYRLPGDEEGESTLEP